MPALPIEVLPGNESVPRAIADGPRSDGRILIANRSASLAGIQAGLKVGAALALLPGLDLSERHPGLERQALCKLADRAGQWTSLVSTDFPGALLLEVGGSLRLFGGLESLRQQVIDDMRVHGHAAMACIAPTARGAYWLAGAGQPVTITQVRNLPAHIGALSVGVCGWPKRVVRLLAQIGVTRLSGCMRLPRADLARRIGPKCLDELDQALGRRPEAIRSHGSIRNFTDALELHAATVDVDQVLRGFMRLLEGLERRLVSEQSSVTRLWVRLTHDGAPASVTRIGLQRPASDTGRLLELAQAHFSDARFAAPVTALSVHARLVERQVEFRPDLFGYLQDSFCQVDLLMERLRSRLGDDAIYALRLFPEHRPEHAWLRAWQPSTDDAQLAPGCAARRPLWLLSAPLALRESQGLPCYSGALALAEGPERIETGWWDRRDVRRDYYVARHARGMRLWVFRDYREQRWYLHGVFG